MSKKVVVVGSGFGGLSAACYLAAQGHSVSVIEQHATPGGRARQYIRDGYTFDMGPSWYWMPDVMDEFFRDFDKEVSDYFRLFRLDPSYRVYGDSEVVDIPANYDELCGLFEALEPGSAMKLDIFLDEAKLKYDLGMKGMATKPGVSLFELFDLNVLKSLAHVTAFTSIKKDVAKRFRHPLIRQILEFPVLFLGAMPEQTPALYSLMNHADIKLGTWYPDGGMYSLVRAMHDLAVSLGVDFYFNEKVTGFEVHDGRVTHVHGEGSSCEADVVLSNADYHFTEAELVPDGYRSYSEDYWSRRKMAPACQLFFIGLDRKVDNLEHHSLFFDVSFEEHARAIYSNPSWPESPLFYVSCASKTDENVAPAGTDGLFVLVPVAPGLDDHPNESRYLDRILQRLESHVGSLRNNIVFVEPYAPSAFGRDYNAFKNNAYGLANTLGQTANLKPSIRSKKLRNLFYTGQLTVPGPGVPTTILSGKIAAGQISKYIGNRSTNP